MAEMCEGCKAEFTKLLDERMAVLLARAQEYDAEQKTDEHDDVSETSRVKSICFHLMEMQRKVHGKTTAY